MAIPAYEQKPNPDYARLRRLYSADHVAAIEMTVHVTEAQRGKTVAITKTITDPLR